jgi:hypothetical protein
MIKERRKEQVKPRAPKKASNADRSVATGRAKRDAAATARRGLAQEKKPNAMDVERETYRQARKTDNAKKAREKKATGGRTLPDPTPRALRRKKGAVDPPAAIFGGRVPSRKQVEAAVKGMEAAGFKVPQGHQVMVTFVPVQAPVAMSNPQNAKGGKKGAKQGGRPGGNQAKGDGRKKK